MLVKHKGDGFTGSLTGHLSRQSERMTAIPEDNTDCKVRTKLLDKLALLLGYHLHIDHQFS